MDSKLIELTMAEAINTNGGKEGDLLYDIFYLLGKMAKRAERNAIANAMEGTNCD